ncbi:hypothetical protein NDU88_001891 [Pleurodeles waltl]|uniref:Uncharacterized protein n=1 Tax=Pleurodeles waltl TaxID=8319 RepID=A0AAV7MVV5_PLEWA|nr:hypothetical protein NDU88_001891 [Pleurodeles waltl]
MGRHRWTDVSQGKTIEQYTTAVPLPQRSAARLGGTEEGQSGMTPAVDLSRAKILAAIQGSTVALEGKIETVVEEVNLLRVDLRKVSDKVKVVEGSIVELQMEVLSGGRSHFFEQPEEGQIWLEMWDKVTLSRPTGTGGVAHRASRADRPDWRICEGGLSEDTVARGSVEDPALRIEIHDGTMAAVSAGLVDGSGSRPEFDSLLASAQD